MTAVSVSMRKSPGGDELAGGEPIADRDMGVRSPRDHDESDPGEDEANPEKAAGDVFGAARADPAPENTGDQKTEKRQEDDQLVHGLSPSAN